LEGDFLIDFPLPLLRFGLGRLGSTRTRSELEATGFLFDMEFYTQNFGVVGDGLAAMGRPDPDRYGRAMQRLRIFF
jgi:hypothetical protein